MLLVMGIIDFGLLFQQYEVITNAAREGARVGVLPSYTPADALARVDQYMTSSFLSQSGTWTRTATINPAVNIGGACMTTITVQVSYPHQYLFLGGIGQYFGAVFAPKTLNASSTMRREVTAALCP
jgi:Flp pilus assembly protein TadG